MDVALIGLVGVVLGTIIGGVINFIANHQNHKKALKIQEQTFKLENKKLYAQKHEELMNDFLKLLTLADEALKLYNDEMFVTSLGLPNSLSESISNTKNSSITKVRLYFPELNESLDTFLDKYTDYIHAIEEGSSQITENYAYPLHEARDNYLKKLSAPLNNHLLISNS